MNLILFHKINCPYSAKVRDYISDNDLQAKIKFRDLSDDPEAIAELSELSGGKTQVPCLVIDGKPLFESNDIVHWLQANLVKAA